MSIASVMIACNLEVISGIAIISIFFIFGGRQEVSFAISIILLLSHLVDMNEPDPIGFLENSFLPSFFQVVYKLLFVFTRFVRF